MQCFFFPDGHIASMHPVITFNITDPLFFFFLLTGQCRLYSPAAHPKTANP